MRRWLRPRSRLFRTVLVMAVLAWTALTLNAFAQPLAMLDGSNGHAAMALGGSASAHCNGMPMAHAAPNSHPARSHPPGNGHGCCQHDGCYCISLCNGIAGVPCLDMVWVPLRAPVLVPVHVAPALTQAAPPLRPPIV
jgi:hypothetical protein